MPFSRAEHIIRHVTLRQLQIFEAVVRIGSYTAAADSLHLTQPTVSMQMKKLAVSLGDPLLERSGRALLPTTVGQEVYRVAQQLLGSMLDLGALISEQHGRVAGELRVAAVTSAKYFMPHMLAAFIGEYPDVKPALKVSNRARVLERIHACEDDLAIIGHSPDDPSLEAFPVLDHELVVVAWPDHPLVGEVSVQPDRLLQEPFLMREEGSGTRQVVMQQFASFGCAIHAHMELGSSEAIKQAVMARLGISVLSRQSLRLELNGGHLAILDVVGFPIKRRWYAAHLKARRFPLTARRFLEFLTTEQG